MNTASLVKYSGLLIATSVFSGCSSVDTLSYRQVGACNGSTVHGTPSEPSQAYVLFALGNLSVPPGADVLNFDPTRLYTIDASGNRKYFDPSANMNREGLCNLSAATEGYAGNLEPLPTGGTLNTYIFIPVHTTAANGAMEANQTSYTLYYDTPVNAKGVILSKDHPLLSTNGYYLNCDDLASVLHP
jgi:hypothetical protein